MRESAVRSRAAATLLAAIRRPAETAPPDVDPTALIQIAEDRRILLLAGWLLRQAGTFQRWPAAFRAAFDFREREAIAIDCVRQAELMRVLARLDAERIRALLFKGAALAWSHYPAVHLRVRSDTDLLVAPEDAAAAGRLLETLGYERPAEISGSLVSFQAHYEKRDEDVTAVVHAWDLHWKISNQHGLADTLRFEELWNRKQAIGIAGCAAAPCAVHALLIALVHRAGHHPGTRDPLWIWDLHLLASSLTDDAIGEVQRIALDRGVATLVRDGLAVTNEMFETTAARRIIDGMKTGSTIREARTIAEGRAFSQIDLLGLDLRALPDWRTRAALLREHLFPPAAYMAARYGARPWTLPASYALRIVRGAPKWLRRR